MRGAFSSSSAPVLICQSLRNATTRLPAMFGAGGDPWRMPPDPAAQLSYSTRKLVVSDPSSFKHADTNSLDMVTSPDMQNAGKSQQAEVELIAAHSKKLQDDLQEQGLKIKHHEDNLKYLKTLKSNLDETILDMQVALGKYDKASFVRTKKEDPAHVKSEEETIENILKHENSGAAIVYRMKIQAKALPSDHSLTKDVIGIVATLGKVDDNNLSRLLSEYLGLETMLAVVCKTYEGVKALEVYNREGLIDKNLGLHGFAASIGKPLAGRFLVICLEDIRPFAGEFIADDPQRRLALLKPRLPNGETPSGFLGFAVNMITIEPHNLYCTSKNGGSLRETLFYHLFSNLQVYRSREDMVKALTCIRNGAISLDGGMIRNSGVFSLGRHEKDIDLKFPTGSEMFNLPEGYLEIENSVKETKWKRDRTCEDMKREQDLFTHARFNYEKKKQELIQFLAKSSSNLSQYPMGSGGSTPR
ncbi:protein DEFECTIVE IN MERISTEM SILENCING 3-like [Salvia miltiorrhiza]|uniref:protein DEFECTIVE IN MERISTEM SILENCING 3-like n=1 Tax=Salvia miltiorrhiza TaxID=226208 RepID=UPI0025AC8BC0|nr:protein DEFECTIVE IN MERISTEM SILENCING 3-like [Salvia miltiorrhiza]